MKNILIGCVAFGIAFHCGLAQKKNPVATVFKPIGDVTYKTESKEWAAAKPATPLLSGDLVKTGENSFAIVKFLENSVLRVQEKSEITISGEISKNKEFSKNVYLQRGELGFDVKKRQNEKFEFSTPTSVASIRGTGGLLITGGDSNDVLILSHGLVEFKNLLSNFAAMIKGGQTAYSQSDGKIIIKESSPEDKRLLNINKPDSGKSEGSNIGNDSSSTSSSGITIGLTLNGSVVNEKSDMTISVEITRSSLTLDSLKSIGGTVSLYYKPKKDLPFKTLSKDLAERETKFTVPASDVFAPSLQAYAVVTLKDGSQFFVPHSSPDSNPQTFAVQSAESNKIQIEFTDPSGKRKNMIIEYK
jgi:hypothetical protein